MTTRTKRIFISDIHLGMSKPWTWFPYYEDGHPTDKYMHNLVDFIEWVGEQQDVKDLVLLGDVWDYSTWPAELEPPPLRDIMLAPENKPFNDAINALHDRGINVLYVDGNHDMNVTHELLAEALPHAIYAGRAYTSRPIYAAHGHLQTMFSGPDPTQRRPLGYFLTRLLTKADGNNISSDTVLKSSLDDMLEAVFTSLTIPSGLFEATMEAAGATEQTPIVLPGGTTVTCAQVKERYRETVDIRLKQLGLRRTIQMLEGDLGFLQASAERVAKEDRHRVVILGHSHKRELDKDTIFVYDHIYVNTDTWIIRQDQPYVTVRKSGGEVLVTLWKWKGKGVEAESWKEEAVSWP